MDDNIVRTFYSDASHNYMVIECPHELRDNYQYKMLAANQIRGLLPCSSRCIDNQEYLYYDITSRQSMEDVYDRKPVRGADMEKLLGDLLRVEKTLTDAARAFGITANALGYKPNSDKEGEDVMLVSIFGNKLLPAEVFESYGTIRFINEFPLVILALLTGGTLVMDEFDASIHPMALMNIINIFHNDEVNRNGAQLIFNTHNPIFLDATLLRRDEIKFVERDETTGNSIHYALSDFKTADGIRKGEDYMNNYFVSRYGAIRDVDFSPILESIISGNEVAQDA